MGTLKSVCSRWFGLMSHDRYEHTHLRLWIAYAYQAQAQATRQRYKTLKFRLFRLFKHNLQFIAGVGQIVNKSSEIPIEIPANDLEALTTW